MNKTLLHLLESAGIFVLGFLVSVGYGSLLVGNTEENYRGLIICMIGALLFLSGLIWFCTARILDALYSLRTIEKAEEKVKGTLKDETNPL